MTSIVGVLCSNGVVIGADSAATLGTGHIQTIEQPFEKIEIVNNKVIFVGTGEVGLGQRFSNVVNQLWNQGLFNSGNPWEIAQAISGKSLEGYLSTGMRIFPNVSFPYTVLLAFPVGDEAHLFDISGPSFQPEKKEKKDRKLWFTSYGVAEQITDSFLAFLKDVFWQKSIPSVYEGIFATCWTLDNVVAVNAGGVNGPINISVLEKNGGAFNARVLSDRDLQETRQYISEAKKVLVDFRNGRFPPESIPEVPIPNFQAGPINGRDPITTQVTDKILGIDSLSRAASMQAMLEGHTKSDDIQTPELMTKKPKRRHH